MNPKRLTVPALKEYKNSAQKIVALTAYDFSLASILDLCEVDLILVGDSLAMVTLGQENTLSVSLEQMIHHTKAVRRGTQRALLVGDMPFMSYQISDEDAVRNAARLVQEGGAEAVKLEGGGTTLSRVSAIANAGISVMGHVGLTPQSVHQFGGYKVQGKLKEDAEKIKQTAMKLEEAGAFSVVLEGIPKDLAGEITDSLSIPTIGIGAGPLCDGQILVVNDMLGLNLEFYPKFIKKFMDGVGAIRTAVDEYVSEVRAGQFPAEKHCYRGQSQSKAAPKNVLSE